MPDVIEMTVVVATRDRPEAVSRCVRALIGQEATPRQVIIVDQGNEPLPAELVTGFGDLEVVLLRDDGIGLSRARNLAVDAARCPFIAVVDDDCVPADGWLAAIAQEFARDDADGVCGPVIPLSPDGDRIFPVSSRVSMIPAGYTCGAVPWRVGTGGNFAARRSLVRNLGGYDCRLGAGSEAGGGEDVDLIYRMLRAGARIRYSPEAVVRHERVTEARRRATRRSYGRGIGTFVGLRGREGDPRVWGLLLRWVVQRLVLLGRAVLRLDRLAVIEEPIVLVGTAAGVAHGLRLVESCRR